MKRIKRQGTRMPLLPLERGLVRSARREKMTWDAIAEALHRDVRTLQKAVKTKSALVLA